MPQNKNSMHFIYWDLLRKGKSQVEIADMYDISRQAVNKTIKAQNHKIMVRLLELARSISALVEWQDEAKGVLVGIVPQLEDRVCVILIDSNDLNRVFYSKISAATKKDNDNLIGAIRGSLDINIPKGTDMEKIIATLVSN